MLLGRRSSIGQGTGGIHQVLIVHCSPPKKGQIGNSGIMLFIMQPRNVGKMGVLHPQLLRKPVHPLHRSLHRTEACPRKRPRRLCTGGQHRGIKQVADRHRLPHGKARHRGVCLVESRIILVDQHNGGIQIFNFFQRSIGGHHLGQRRGINPFSGALGIQHPAVGGIKQQCVAALQNQPRRPPSNARRGSGQQHAGSVLIRPDANSTPQGSHRETGCQQEAQYPTKQKPSSLFSLSSHRRFTFFFIS